MIYRINWLKISLFNLLIVSLLGILMRYKIAFEFPLLDQKHVQLAHSNFAFAAWISQTLFVFIINSFRETWLRINQKRYDLILFLNLISAYSLLISFITSGYSIVSIILSIGNLLISCIMAIFLLVDLQKLNSRTNHATIWYKSGLWFLLLSAFGYLGLVYIVASKTFTANGYLGTSFFYLHFQYNGWFFFACAGLFISYLQSKLPDFTFNSLIYKLVVISCVPAYFLSTLWAKLPVWLFWTVVIAASLQVLAWLLFLLDLKKLLRSNKNIFSPLLQSLYVFVAIALSIKFLLQLASTFPEVSKLAFGFRPIVVAYLHLMLLAFVTVFVLSQYISNKIVIPNNRISWSIYLFLCGVFLNEVVLMIQGIASFSYISVPYANESLFISSILIFIGLGFFISSIKWKKSGFGNVIL